VKVYSVMSPSSPKTEKNTAAVSISYHGKLKVNRWLLLMHRCFFSPNKVLSPYLLDLQLGAVNFNLNQNKQQSIFPFKKLILI